MTERGESANSTGVENLALDVSEDKLSQDQTTGDNFPHTQEGNIVLPNENMGQKSKGTEKSPLLQADEEFQGDPASHLKVNPTSFRISQMILFLVFMVAGVALAGGLIFGSISFNEIEGELQDDEAMLKIAGIDLEEFIDKSPVGEYRFAAVAADAGPCSTIGTDIMAEKRGSVVDAAIASQLCLGLHNAHSMGIGGGHFMMIYDVPKDGMKREVFSLDSRETAPAAATKNMFQLSPSSAGGLRIGVPGTIRGMHEAWKRFGRLPWKDLFQPTIKMCREGYRIGPALGNAIQDKIPTLTEFEELGKTFTRPDGSLYKEGDIATRQKLADTLDILAEEGPEAFYDGALTEDIYMDIKDCDGIITVDDIINYKAKWKKPSVTRLRSNLTVYTMPAPSGGPVLQYILNILEGFNFSKSDLGTLEKRILTYHRIIETMKFGYAQRSYLGDPDFEDIKDNLEELTSRSFADHTRSFINDKKTYPPEYYHPANKRIQRENGTSHLSIVGPDGVAVAVTSTINNYFGSKCVGKRTGIIFNDEMSDFSEPGDELSDGFTSAWANFIEPGKRPLSSMSPTIFVDDNGEPQMVLGTSGGIKIISTTAYVAAHVLFLGKPLNEAIDLPRLHHQLIPNEISHSSDFDKKILKGLEAKGHVVNSNSLETATQGIYSTCGSCRPDCHDPCLYATSDYRKGGYPDGY